MMHPASGTKILLEYEGRYSGRDYRPPQKYLLAYQRDDNPNIPFPNMWDYFGGGVEPGEMALPPEEALLTCAERELKEELGLIGVRLHMMDIFESQKTPGRLLGRAFGRLTDRNVSEMQFGSEGRWFKFFLPEEIVTIDFVPQLQDYTREVYGLDYAARPLEQTA